MSIEKQQNIVRRAPEVRYNLLNRGDKLGLSYLKSLKIGFVRTLR